MVIASYKLADSKEAKLRKKWSLQKLSYGSQNDEVKGDKNCRIKASTEQKVHLFWPLEQ